jgi:hypothetical protein
MTEDKKRKGGVTYHGMYPADHPFYTRAGWNFILAPNLNLKKPNASTTGGDDGGMDQHDEAERR